MSPLYPCLPVYAPHCLRNQCRLLHVSPWNCKPFNAYNYMHTAMAFDIHTQGMITTLQCIALQDHGHGMGVTKMGNIVPRARIEPTSLASCASVQHVGSLTSPLYPLLPVYTAHCIRGQCILLHIFGTS